MSLDSIPVTDESWSHIWDNPIAINEDTTQTVGFGEKDATSRYMRLAEEAMHFVVGPMPVSDFLKDFMKSEKIKARFGGMPSAKDAFEEVFKPPPQASTEAVHTNADVPAPEGVAAPPTSSTSTSSVLEPTSSSSPSSKKPAVEGNATAEALPKKGKKRKRGKKVSEVDRYQPMADAINIPKRCPGYVFLNTSAHVDSSHGKRGAFKPDLCCYSNEHVSALRVEDEPAKGRTDMGLAALFIEVKTKADLDCFKDPPPDADRDSWQFLLNFATQGDDARREMRRSLGQNVAYAIEIFARQHRHCVYSISLSGSTARLIRWDRAGAVVTEAFDILQSPEYLCEFLWCFAWIGDGGRGHDLSVRLTTNPSDIQRFKEAVRAHVKTQHMPSEIHRTEDDEFQQHYQEDAVFVVSVFDCTRDSNVILELLVSRPCSYPMSLAGKGTHGFWALDRKPDSPARILYLKDTWKCELLGDLGLEGSVMNIIKAAGIANMPSVVVHGCVYAANNAARMTPDRSWRVINKEYAYYQITLTQEFLRDSCKWVCGRKRSDCMIHSRVVRRTHYRLVTDIAGYPLMGQFTGTKELFKVTLDVFKVLRQAHEKCSIAHRDVGAMSIMLYRHDDTTDSDPNEPRTGYLLDWDLATSTTLVDHPTRKDKKLWLGAYGHPYPAAWQYVCAALAQGIRLSQYKLVHDTESLFYVVLHCAMLWLPINATTPAGSVKRIIEAMFDGGTSFASGQEKSKNMDEKHWTHRLVWRCQAIRSWLDDMIDNFPDEARTRLGGETGMARVEWSADTTASLWQSALDNDLPNDDRNPTLPTELQREASRSMLGAPHEATKTATTATDLTRQSWTESVTSADVARFRGLAVESLMSLVYPPVDLRPAKRTRLD